MSDPFKIAGPALVSFSGGRTSAYMLWRILQAHGGALPDDVRVTFANTGKEMPETLDFVRDCGERWGAGIVWLEFRLGEHGERFARVDYGSASRHGEPYDALLTIRPMLPNPTMRFCTTELKIRVMRDYARSLGWEHWTNVVGLRADERHRVANLNAQRERWESIAPLAKADVTKATVSEFWRKQNFDLRLPNVNGTTPLGNCDLCFLKSAATIQGIMRTRPDLAVWWIAKEESREPVAKKPSDARFRKDRPSYAAMLDAVERQVPFDFGDADRAIDCLCVEDAA